MASLVTLDALKEYLKEPTSSQRHDETLGFALDAASEKIRDYCDRIFTKDDTADTPSATVRTFVATSPYRLLVRDFYDTTDLVVKTDTTDNGTYDTTWTVTTDYMAGPFDQRDGWPYYTIEAVGSRTFPVSRRPTVQVTAFYGWSAVPDAVEQTCLELAAELWKRGDAPFGVVGVDDFGTVQTATSDMRLLSRLKMYRRFPVLVA
jgi:hypothetical protein